MKTKKLVLLSLLLSMSIVLSIVESSISTFLFIIPGVKLGLANVVTLVVLYHFGDRDAFLVVTLRILLVGLLAGTIGSPTFYLSFLGGMTAFLGMYIIKKLRIFSIVSVSIVGALGHSVGQIIVAIYLLSTSQLIYYLPILIALSVPTGIFTGLVSKRFIDILKNSI